MGRPWHGGGGKCRPSAPAGIFHCVGRRAGQVEPREPSYLPVWNASPMSKTPPYLIKWQPHPADADHLRSAAAVARFALTSPDLTPQHRTRLLNNAFWYRTEAASKIRLRYRSGGVRALSVNALSSWRSQLRHDHVQTRASLIGQMIARPDEADHLLATAVACLVTKAEHSALAEYDKKAEGWDRYRLARVDVYDFSVDPPRPFIVGGELTNS